MENIVEVSPKVKNKSYHMVQQLHFGYTSKRIENSDKETFAYSCHSGTIHNKCPRDGAAQTPVDRME
jgi:hypothetical protein